MKTDVFLLTPEDRQILKQKGLKYKDVHEWHDWLSITGYWSMRPRSRFFNRVRDAEIEAGLELT